MRDIEPANEYTKHMNIKSVLDICKTNLHSLMVQIASSSKKAYYAILFLYMVSNLIYMIGWELPLHDFVWNSHVALFSVVMWSSAIYIIVILAVWKDNWKSTIKVIIICISLFGLTVCLSRIMTRDSYAWIVGVLLCILVYGKNYRQILYSFLLLLLITLTVGLVGLYCGFTFDAKKPYRVYGGHSLGILYPNNWGFLVFAVLVIIWYLFLRRKKLVSLALFWIVAVFMFKYITCNTIAALALVFPIFASAAEFLQDHTSISSTKKAHRTIIYHAIVLLPFIVFGIMMLLCWKMDWVHEHFYKTPLESAAMRFVEGGYAIRLNGLSLFGQPFKQWDASITDYARDIEMKIDSAFTHYLVIRGVLWMIWILTWIAYAHYLCLKRRDYRLIVISFFFLVFSMMERPGLDVWYNFVLLYPLADFGCINHEKHSLVMT